MKYLGEYHGLYGNSNGDYGLQINLLLQVENELIEIRFIWFKELDNTKIKGVWNVNTNNVFLNTELMNIVDTGKAGLKSKKEVLDQCIKINEQLTIENLQQIETLKLIEQ